jgi:1,4-dihydroxy-2-naphthoate octaprenyltransferase
MFNVNFANRHRASRWAWLGLAARSPLRRNFTHLDLPFARNGAVVHCALRTNPMNVVLIAIGCVLMALGLVMLANRSGYVYFVVGPRSVLVVAGVVAVLAFWFLQVAK